MAGRGSGHGERDGSNRPQARCRRTGQEPAQSGRLKRQVQQRRKSPGQVSKVTAEVSVKDQPNTVSRIS